jgi:hypothetical protein
MSTGTLLGASGVLVDFVDMSEGVMVRRMAQSARPITVRGH